MRHGFKTVPEKIKEIGEMIQMEKLFASSYETYKNLVWSVVERSLQMGFFKAVKSIQTYDIMTITEILDVADVTLEIYEIDCMKAYIRELELRQHLNEAYTKKLEQHFKQLFLHSDSKQKTSGGM